MDSVVSVAAAQPTFTYDPRSVEPSLTGFTGTLPLAYRVVQYDSNGAMLLGSWNSFPIDIVAPYGSPTIQNFHLVNVTDPSAQPIGTGDPTVAGTVAGASWGATVQFDYNDDGVVDETTTVAYDGTFTDALPNLPYGDVDVQARVEAGATYGPWASLTFDHEPPLPPAVNFPRSYTVIGPSGPVHLTSPTLAGNVVPGAVQGPITIQFSTGPAVPPAWQTVANQLGYFAFTFTGLGYGTVNIYARSVIANPLGGLSYGQWTEATFIFDRPAGTPPTISNLRLANPTPPAGSTDTTTTTDPTITGQATEADGSADFQTIQLSYGADSTVDATTTTGPGGIFTFTPAGLSSGPVTINVRAVVWDNVAQENLTGNWSTISFTYQPPAAPAVQISQFSLVSNIGTNGANVASDPTVTGQLTASNGASVASQLVEFALGDGVPVASALTDSQGSFTFTPFGLSAGQVTVQVRLKSFNYATGADQYGDWTSLTFTYQPNLQAAPCSRRSVWPTIPAPRAALRRIPP